MMSPLDGETLKVEALDLLAERREAVVRRAQRALLTVLLKAGSATADDVRELVELPPGISPKCFGAAPGPLARAGIILRDGYALTTRAKAHARPLSIWRLGDRGKALLWLADNPALPDPADRNEAVQRSLFPESAEVGGYTRAVGGATSVTVHALGINEGVG